MLILHFQNHAILIGNATLFAIFSHILKIFIPLCYFTLDFSSRYIIILRIMNLHCQKYFQRILSVYIIIDTFAKDIWILVTLFYLHLAAMEVRVFSILPCGEYLCTELQWLLSFLTSQNVIKILVQFVFMCVNLFVGNQGEYSLEEMAAMTKDMDFFRGGTSLSDTQSQASLDA